MYSVFARRDFFDGAASRDGGQLEERSVRVVIDFMEWPAEQIDALDAVPQYTKAEADELGARYRGFKAYIMSKQRFNEPEDE